MVPETREIISICSSPGPSLVPAVGLVDRNEFHRRHGLCLGPAVGVGSLDIRFQLGPELFDAILDRPGCAVGEAADRRAGHDTDRVANLGEQVEVLQSAATGFDARHHLRGPTCPLAARRALAAALVREETATVEQKIHHARLLVHDDDRSRAEAEAAEFSWAVEIERAVEFFSGEQTHANAAGNCGLGLAPLPDAAAEAINQLGYGESERRFVAARLIDVAGEAI